MVSQKPTHANPWVETREFELLFIFLQISKQERRKMRKNRGKKLEIHSTFSAAYNIEKIDINSKINTEKGISHTTHFLLSIPKMNFFPFSLFNRHPQQDEKGHKQASFLLNHSTGTSNPSVINSVVWTLNKNFMWKLFDEGKSRFACMLMKFHSRSFVGVWSWQH